MMPLTDAQAEAGKAVAETTGKALDLTKGIGSFIAETIGTIPQDLLGLVGGDWLHEKRQRNLAQMQARTARILEGIERERISEPSPSVVMPLLEAAKDEGREELQELWAGLLASAMLDGGWRTRRSLFTLTASLEPVDAFVLRALSNRRRLPAPFLYEDLQDAKSWLREERVKGAVSVAQWQLAVDTLIGLGCISDNIPGGIPRLTVLGEALMEALSTAPAPAPFPDTD